MSTVTTSHDHEPVTAAAVVRPDGPALPRLALPIPRTDLGWWSPWARTRGYRREYDAIADQLLTLLTAGHETTATTLAWAVERLRRRPEVLRRLAGEADAGGSELREATILEVQQAGHLSVDPVRRRGPAMHRRRLRAHGDERVLRTLLRDFTLEPTNQRGERWHWRGIAYCPARGGRAVVRRRVPAAERSGDGQEG